jgi:hypothetical protein
VHFQFNSLYRLNVRDAKTVGKSRARQREESLLSGTDPFTSETRIALGHCPYKEELPVTSVEAGCENKCASPYIGERFGENSVGGKWLMGAVLRIALTLTGRGQGAVGG